MTHRSSPTFDDVVSLIKSRLQVSILDGSNWLIEGLSGNGLLSIKPAVNRQKSLAATFQETIFLLMC